MTDLSVVLNAKPVDQWQERIDREHEMERMLRSYIDDFGSRRKFAFGQLPNLLHTIAKICEEHSKLEDDDWEKAAVLLEEVSEKCDMKYEGGRMKIKIVEDASKPFYGKCTDCQHIWPAAYYPMELAQMAKILKSARCPKCGASGKKIAIPKQRDGELIEAERAC